MEAKITLGDLKKIHSGKVIELASVYRNGVTLTVEDKVIARGELVIINDKYGVKVTDVVVPTIDTQVVSAAQKPVASKNSETDETVEEVSESLENQEAEQGTAAEEDEFDYSDFDLEEDI